MKPLKLLAIDVGGGTQDILFYDEEKTVENCFKLVLPSQTVIVAEKIKQATKKRKDICLTGQLMGGGASSSAIMQHIKAGLKVYSLPQPAKTIKDNLDVVREKGIIIVDEVPDNTLKIELQDINIEALKEALAKFEVSLPENIAVAIQDHGENLEISNRIFRFQHWENFVKKGGKLKDLTYIDPPNYLTRMLATKKNAPDAIFMDTGPAAVRGALLDEKVKPYINQGLVAINIGNQHTVALLVKGNRVFGLFEHHTKILNKDKLKSFVTALQEGTLENSTIFNDKGHGAYIHKEYLQEPKFDFITITGPNRDMAEGLGYHKAVPLGDMMIAGCFGLVEAVRELLEND